MTDSTTDELRTTEADRLSDLLDSAQSQLLGREPVQAIAIWKTMISEGGNTADWGHLEYADYLYREDQQDRARIELAQLVAGRRVLGAPWSLAAEMLEELGDLEAALFFFSAAVEVLTPDQLSTTCAPAWARQLRAGRRRVRWALDIPLDDMDLGAEIGTAEMDEKWIDLPDLLGTPRVIDGRLHFWARDQFGHAQCLWPDHTSAENAAEYYRQIERVLRTVAVGRVLAVPRTIGAVEDDLDPAVRDARSMAEVLAIVNQVDEGMVVKWPPGRNQGCWCGSAVKYKKCCGGPPAITGF